MDNASAARVRTALLADVPVLVSLTEQRQGRAFAAFPEYYEPISASTLGERLRSVIESFANGTAQNGSVCMVAERDGDIAAYALVSLATAPPVYAPGGPVGFIGGFTARDNDADGTAASALLETATAYVKNQGAVCVVVPCAAGEIETAKAELLAKSGFYVASEWHSRPLGNVGYTATTPPHLLRAATVEDAPCIANAADQKRRLYETFAPIFWRNNPDGKASQTPFLAKQLADDKVAAFLAPNVGEDNSESLDGYILVKDGYVDDYAVAEPKNWSTVGRALLDAAMLATQKLLDPPRRMLIVCGQKDTPKHEMLAAQGYHVAENWWVRDFV